MNMMTTEQKAAAYDEALNLMKDCIPDENGLVHVRPDEIFSELKESEDERIRKELIQFFKEKDEEDYNKWIPKAEILAWLEKQGEPVEINPTEFDIRLQALIAMFGGLPKEELIGSLSFWLNAVKNDGTYKDEEKQGRQEILFVTNIENSIHPILVKKTELGRCTVEHEQKPDGKVKPNFKVGDWISGYYTNYKVTAINSKGYAVEDTDGNKINILFENEKFHHLFTIADAKGGDVLYSDCLKILWIFKGRDTVYCGCNLNYNDGAFSGEGHIETPTDAIPATKEQRDTLFTKMREAGYEWDAEKKELKKIEAIENDTTTTTEIQEDKDEIIREYLITYFTGIDDRASNLKGKDIIAWVKRQGEQKPKD